MVGGSQISLGQIADHYPVTAMVMILIQFTASRRVGAFANCQIDMAGAPCLSLAAS
jgi:hypothetical protein